MNKKELERLGYKVTKEIIDGKEYVVVSSTRPRRESGIKEISKGIEDIIKEVENE